MKGFLKSIVIPSPFKRKTKETDGMRKERSEASNEDEVAAVSPCGVASDRSSSGSTISLTKEAPSIETLQLDVTVESPVVITPENASNNDLVGRPGKPHTMRSQTVRPVQSQNLRPILERQASFHRRSSHQGAAFSPALLQRIHSEKPPRAARWIEEDPPIHSRKSPTSAMEPWMLMWAKGAPNATKTSVKALPVIPNRATKLKVCETTPVYLPNSPKLDSRLRGKLCCSCWLARLPAGAVTEMKTVARSDLVYLQVSPTELTLLCADGRPSKIVELSSIDYVSLLYVNANLGRAIVLHSSVAPLRLLPVSLPEYFFTTSQKVSLIDERRFCRYKYGLVPPFYNATALTGDSLNEYAGSEQQDASMYLNFTLDSLLKQARHKILL